MLTEDLPSSIAECLDNAAESAAGMCFRDDAGEVVSYVTYAELRELALRRARRLRALGLPTGSRVAIVADTSLTFASFFFACQYARLVPVPLPAYPQAGGADAYQTQLHRFLLDCQARLAVASDSHVTWLRHAAVGTRVVEAGTAAYFDAGQVDEAHIDVAQVDEAAREAESAGDRARNGAVTDWVADSPAYIQYTSGSTSQPRGVIVDQRAAMINLHDIFHHVIAATPSDRFVSWLPFYHDMGLVAFLLGPVFTALSVDYLSPRAFAKRPGLWLRLISEQRATLSSSPATGYAICARRLRSRDLEGLDLSCWRVACVGAERIQPEHLRDFARLLEPVGFDPRSLLACYGMAECVLAVSMARPGEGLAVDTVDRTTLTDQARAEPCSGTGAALSLCGALLPGYELSIVDSRGLPLSERHCGRILLRGPTIMKRYLNNEAASQRALSSDGWLDTGDIGYRIGDQLVVTARSKDLVIVNGRNLWPEDLEYLAQQVPGVGFGRACAFGVDRPDGSEAAVVVVESRQSDRDEIAVPLNALIGRHFGIQAVAVIVPPGTLPRTSSGKLSRTRARADYLQRSIGPMSADAQPAAAADQCRCNTSTPSAAITSATSGPQAKGNGGSAYSTAS